MVQQEKTFATILVVDDNDFNIEIIRSVLTPHGFHIESAYNGLIALEIVRKNPPDLILLDILMPGIDGYEVCRRLKANESTRLIPIVLLTSLSESDDKIRGIDVGADDFLHKDFDAAVLLARVRSLIRMKRLNDRLLRAEQVIFTLLNAIEAKDPYTQGHVVRVRFLCEAMGTRMGLCEKDLNFLRIGAMLHDIGKIGLRDGLLCKPESLTEAEYENEVRRHPEIGATILEPLRYPPEIIRIVRNHHERLDGTGYPDELTGERIPLLTRIISVADVYDALRHDRPYRQGMPTDQVLSYLSQEAANGRLDSKVVEALHGVDREILSLVDPELLYSRSLQITDEEAAVLLGIGNHKTHGKNPTEI